MASIAVNGLIVGIDLDYGFHKNVFIVYHFRTAGYQIIHLEGDTQVLTYD